MKVCKTLFGRINRPSQSCSRFARLGCEICLTLLDAKKCSSPYGCRSWNIFLLSVGQVLLSPLRRRYLHQCQRLLVFRFEPRKRVQSSKLPVFRNCAGFSIVAPAFLCRLSEPFPVPSLSSPDTGVPLLSTLSLRRFHKFYVRNRPPKACSPKFCMALFRARFLRVWHVLRLNGTTPVSTACGFPPQFVLRTAAMRRFVRLVARLPAVWLFNK